MRKFNKVLSVILASTTLVSVCPTQQKASALTPAEAAVIGIFGAGTLAGCIAAISLGVKNADITKKLEAEKQNPQKLAEEIKQLNASLTELGGVRKQLEDCKQELAKTRAQLYECKNSKTEKPEYSELYDQKCKLDSRVSQLEKEKKDLYGKYDELMLHSLACQFLVLCHNKPELEQHISALEPYKTDRQPITARNIAKLFGIIKVYGYDGRFTEQLRDLAGFSEPVIPNHPKSKPGIIDVFLFHITSMIKELMASLGNTGAETLQRNFIQEEFIDAHRYYKRYYDGCYYEMKPEFTPK